MSDVWLYKKDFDDIGDAIREKLDTETEYTIEDMASAINSIDTSSSSNPITLTNYVTRNITLVNIQSTIIRPYAFCNSININKVKLSEAITISDHAFLNNTSLTEVILSKVTSIGDYAFYMCPLLESLTIETNLVCSLGTNVFSSNCPIASGTGYIYVPADLVDSYKEALGWSEYADQIVAI